MLNKVRFEKSFKIFEFIFNPANTEVQQSMVERCADLQEQVCWKSKRRAVDNFNAKEWWNKSAALSVVAASWSWSGTVMDKLKEERQTLMRSLFAIRRNGGEAWIGYCMRTANDF